jgi:hypothetical protein
MDRALFYGIVVGGVYSLCVLIVLGNAPIAMCSGVLIGLLALARGWRVWG